MKKGSESWGYPSAGLCALSGVFPLPLLCGWVVGLLFPLLPVSSSPRSSFILEEASLSKSFRKGSTLDPPGGLSRLSLASASSIAAAVAATARLTASSPARAASASRARCSRAFSASKAASSASVLALPSGTFLRAASMASLLAASAWALAIASAWALSSASFLALSWASPSSNAFTSASLRAMASWTRRASWAAAASCAAASTSLLTPDSRCFLCGCSRDPGRNGRLGRGMEGQAPHGNASKEFHRPGVTHSSLGAA